MPYSSPSSFDILDSYAAEDERRRALTPTAEQLNAARWLLDFNYGHDQEALLRPIKLCNETTAETCRRILGLG
jgi:hypothetical protein